MSSELHAVLALAFVAGCAMCIALLLFGFLLARHHAFVFAVFSVWLTTLAGIFVYWVFALPQQVEVFPQWLLYVYVAMPYLTAAAILWTLIEFSRRAK